MRSIELILSPQVGPRSTSTITVYTYAPAPAAPGSLSQTVFLTINMFDANVQQRLTPAEARILANDLLMVAAVVDQQYERPAAAPPASAPATPVAASSTREPWTLGHVKRPQRNAADESAGAIVEHGSGA